MAACNEVFYCGDYFDNVLDIFCFYDYDANASEAV